MHEGPAPTRVAVVLGAASIKATGSAAASPRSGSVPAHLSTGDAVQQCVAKLVSGDHDNSDDSDASDGIDNRRTSTDADDELSVEWHKPAGLPLTQKYTGTIKRGCVVMGNIQVGNVGLIATQWDHRSGTERLMSCK